MLRMNRRGKSRGGVGERERGGTDTGDAATKGRRGQMREKGSGEAIERERKQRSSEEEGRRGGHPTVRCYPVRLGVIAICWLVFLSLNHILSNKIVFFH